MNTTRYERFIKLFEDTNTAISEPLKKELRRFDDADKRFVEKMQDFDTLEYMDGISEAEVCNYNLLRNEVEDKAIISIYAEYLDEALATLNEKQRTVVVDYYFLGMTQVEIANTEGLPTSSVHNCLKSAHKKLRSFFENKL